MRKVINVLFSLSLSFFSLPAIAQTSGVRKYVKTDQAAQKLVGQILKSAPIIDGHNDLFAWYFGCNYKNLPKYPQDITDYPLDTLSKGQTDIPRWRKGGVGGVQINAYADSLPSFLDAYDLLYRLELVYNKDLRIVTSSADMRKVIQSEKSQSFPCWKVPKG